MTSKQAVSAVLNHQLPDYIPLGTYVIDCDTVERVIGHETYVRDKIKIQLALWDGRRDEVAQSLKEDSVELFKRLPSVDIIIPQKEAALLPPKNYQPPKMKKLDDKTWADDKGNVYQITELTNDITLVKSPPTPQFPPMHEASAPDPSVFEAYDHLISAMGDSRFLAGACGGFNVMPLPGGMEEGLMAYLLEPERMEELLASISQNENYLDIFFIKDGIDAIFVEKDTGTTISSLMSPNTFREFCLPVMRRRVEQIKRYRDKVIIHSCGNTWNLLPMFIEAGIDGYQSLQTGAGMELDKLKAAFGDKLAFWGGVSVETLLTGTMNDVRRNVRDAMERGKPGFILGPSHSIAYGVPYNNFMALLDEHERLKYNI